MDGCQEGYAALNPRPSVSCQFIHPFNHLLLPVDPVQMFSQNRQAHRLQNVRVLQDHTVGSYQGKERNSETACSELQTSAPAGWHVSVGTPVERTGEVSFLVTLVCHVVKLQMLLQRTIWNSTYHGQNPNVE